MIKKYGVKMTLKEHDPLRLPHLFGDEFSAERWFATKEERQAFLDSYQQPFIYYRKSDRPRFNYELLEREQ